MSLDDFFPRESLVAPFHVALLRAWSACLVSFLASHSCPWSPQSPRHYGDARGCNEAPAGATSRGCSVGSQLCTHGPGEAEDAEINVGELTPKKEWELNQPKIGV